MKETNETSIECLVQVLELSGRMFGSNLATGSCFIMSVAKITLVTFVGDGKWSKITPIMLL